MANIKTKDGIIITGIPEGQEQSDAIRSYVANLRATTGPGTYPFASTPQTSPSLSRPGTPPIQEPTQTFTTPGGEVQLAPKAEGAPTTFEGLTGGLTREILPALTGATLGGVIAGPPGAAAGGAAVVLSKLVGDPTVDAVNSLFGTDFTKPTDALNALFTKLGVAQPESEVERIIQAAARGATETAGTIGLGQTLQAGKGLLPTVKSQVGKVLGSQPVQQLVSGATSAGSAQTAAELNAGPGVQLAAGLVGGALGSKASNFKLDPPPITTAPIKEAKQAGVRLLTSDVKPPKTFAGRFGQSIGEKIPVFGTGQVRAMQQGERVTAVKNLLREFGADDAANISDDIMDDLLKTRSAKLNQFSTAKTEVIKKLSTIAPAVKKEISNLDQSIATKTQKMNALKNKGIKIGNELNQIKALESDIANLTAQRAKNINNVSVENTVNSINGEIRKLKNMNTAEVNPVINRLEDWKTAIQDQDLETVELLRKQIGESFKAPELASVRSTGEKSLTNIYGALREDMGNYIKANGEPKDFNKWMSSNKNLSNMMGELDNAVLKRVLNKGEATPEIVKNMLFSKKKSDVMSLYNNLSPQGRASARTAILAKAAEGSNFVGSDDISPDKFANAVKKLGLQTGVVFSGDDLKEVNGLMRVLNTTKRAGAAAAAPPTGIQNILPVGAAGLASFFGGGLDGFIAAMGTGAGIGGSARLYESKPIRDILMKLPQVVRGSAQEAVLYKRLTETIRAVQQIEE